MTATTPSRAPTLGALAAAYFEYAKPRLKTCDRMSWTFSRYLSPLADRDAMSLTREQVEALRTELSATVSAKTANSVTELLSTLYNRAVESGVIEDYNPVRGLRKIAVDKRNRRLEADELPKFFKALISLKSELLRDYFLLCLLTGEQKTKVLELRWQDLDLKRGAWLIPQRTRQPRLSYLLPEATDLLKRRKDNAVSPWVFPSECSHQECSGQCRLSDSGHLEGPDKSWAALVKRAGIADLRLNDLRNTRQNFEPARVAMSEHYHVADHRRAADKAKRRTAKLREAKRRAANRETSRARKEALREALAKPVLRLPAVRALELSPFDQGSTVPTFRNLFEYYMDNHGNRCKSAGQMRGHFERYLIGIADRPADEIRPSDIQQLHTWLGEHKGRAAANRGLELVKSVYNKSVKWQLINVRNPADSVSLFPLEARDRFLSSPEVARLLNALDEEGRSATIKAFLRTCLFTAARAGNVGAMKWCQLDREAQTWRIPLTKSGKPQTIPLIPEALAAIESQLGIDPVWVFPGRGKTGHIVSPARSWHRLLKRADLTDVRIHDLRRTMGSWQAKTGASMPIISKTLGHSNSRATQIYARLDLDPVRGAMETAAAAMQGAQLSEEKPASNPQQLAALIAGMVTEQLKERGINNASN